MSRVLIAEDSPSIRLLLVRRLEMAGHEVTEARDGGEALVALENPPEAGGPEIALLDAMMPGIGGAEVLRRIKESESGVPVLVVSAVSGISQADEWKSADGHLTKPIDFDDLLGRLDELTSGRPRP